MNLSLRSTSILAAVAALLAALSLSAAAPAPASAAGLIAPAKKCGNVNGFGSQKKAIRSMFCYTNAARKRKGLKAYRLHNKLNFASRRKAIDILRCNEFSHEACGREFQYWIQRSGYRGCSLGENIAWGSGRLGNSRQIFIAWMKSPGHRSAILSRDFRHIGIGLKPGRMSGVSGARVWVQSFGRGC
jgi:uncharacterized protein YkwD